MKSMSPWQFTIFRIVFGLYLAVHFAQLVPWSVELFGARGVLPDASLNPTHRLFPNPLNFDLPDGMVRGFVASLAALSLVFAAGLWRRWISLLLWFGWACLFHRNNLISNPSIPYVGLLLLLCALVPSGEPWSREKSDRPWFMPLWVYRAAWILLAMGYTFSGFTKLFSPSWVDGTAMQYLLENPLARPGLPREWMLGLPAGVLAIGTWAALVAELLFAPLALWRRSRPIIWLLMILMHLGIVFLIDFSDLSFGMLMIHLFTFDPRWLPAQVGAKPPLVLAFDGDCLMCSKSIRFLADEDASYALRFTPLQSLRGQEMEKEHGEGALKSVLLEVDGRIMSRSTAVLRLLAALGGHWRLFGIFGRLVPRVLRDAAYDFVANRRHRWFGKGDACGMPSEALRARLLDQN